MESERFLKLNRGKIGVKTTKSGLQYKMLKQGLGPKPLSKDKVSLYFTAYLFDGRRLWGTERGDEPWVHHLDKTIDGLREGVPLMRVGAKYKFFIPAALAFVKNGFEEVPPGAAVIYDVELLKTEK